MASEARGKGVKIGNLKPLSRVNPLSPRQQCLGLFLFLPNGLQRDYRHYSGVPPIDMRQKLPYIFAGAAEGNPKPSVPRKSVGEGRFSALMVPLPHTVNPRLD
jgi:hypothetical protein